MKHVASTSSGNNLTHLHAYKCSSYTKRNYKL